MKLQRILPVMAFFVLGLSPSGAQTKTDQTLTVTVNGTPGPILSGGDNMGLSGATITFTMAVSEPTPPIEQKAEAASYSVPAGAVTVRVDDEINFFTTTPSTIVAALTPGADVGAISASFGGGPPFVAQIIGTIFLAPDSWKRTVLKHPVAFSPSPQNITAATSATGPGSKIEYTYFGETTVLGLTGTASSTN